MLNYVLRKLQASFEWSNLLTGEIFLDVRGSSDKEHV